MYVSSSPSIPFFNFVKLFLLISSPNITVMTEAHRDHFVFEFFGKVHNETYLFLSNRISV